MITIIRSRDDDPGFVDQAQCILGGCVKGYMPAEVYVIRIRDRFDHKWCHFSGKLLGAAGIRKLGKLTIPPFVPNRVLAQEHYERVGANGAVYEATNSPSLHVHQRSEENFKRLMRRTTDDGTAFWFSSGSQATGRGSIMVYNVKPDDEFGWHINFQRKSAWQIEKVTSTAKTLVEALRDSGRAGAGA